MVRKIFGKKVVLAGLLLSLMITGCNNGSRETGKPTEAPGERSIK